MNKLLFLMRSHGNCMRIRKIFLVESGIREIFLVETEILGFGVRNTAQIIRTLVMIGVQNPLKFQ